MIRYITLTVENYKSIGKASVDFIPGVYSVVGHNEDGQYSSNGAGKSSILQALTLVLYNKDFQGAPLDSVSNRYTGELFKVQLLLEVERNGTKATYLVTNDRKAKKLSILKNGKSHSQTTAKSLKLIQELVGMSEATFKFTHYITTNSILELTSNLSNATLFNEVLQVTELKTMGDDLLQVRKNYTNKADQLKSLHMELGNVHKLLQVTNKYDIADLSEYSESLIAELEELEELHAKHIDPLNKSIVSKKEDIANISLDLSNQQASLEDGTCTLCGTTLATEGKLVSIQESIELLAADLHFMKEDLLETTTRLNELVESYQITKSGITNKLTKVQQDLEIGIQLQEVHKDVLNGSKYTPEYYNQVTKDLRYVNILIDKLNMMRDAIRSGRIYEEVMGEFFKLVNLNIQKYKEVINFDTYEVEASAYKSGMVALLKYQGEEIPVESLSNGEKSRLSLLLLSALLESMSQVTNSESNFLAIDEATSSFDKSGIEELSALFAHLKVLGQSVFIITHGAELQQVEFDGVLVVSKTENVSSTEFIKE